MSAGAPIRAEPDLRTRHASESVLARPVLVLNLNCEPLNVVSVDRALRMVLSERAEVLEQDGCDVRTLSRSLRVPSIIRLRRYVRRPVPELRLTRRSLFARDGHRCQYCGRGDVPLTLDHVLPKTRAGPHDWSNVVACCVRCNNTKGDRTPREAGMALRSTPRRPRITPYISLHAWLSASAHQAWLPYLEPWMGADAPALARGHDAPEREGRQHSQL